MVVCALPVMQVAGTTADGVYVYQVLPCLVSGPQKAGRQYRGGITGFLYCVVLVVLLSQLCMLLPF